MTAFKIPLRQYVGLLRHYLRSQRSSIMGLAVLLVAGLAMQLVNPQLIRYFIDSAQQAETNEALWIAAALFIGVSLLQQLVTVAATYISENVGWIATNKLRGDVAEHCLRLDMTFHKSHTTGSIIERVDGDINALANFFSNFVITLASNLLLVVGILILLFREGWIVGAGMSVFVVLAIYAIQYIRKFAIPHWGKLRQISADFYGFLSEHLEGTEDTRANGASDFVMHKFFSLLRVWLPVRIRAFLGWAAMWITTLVVFAIGNAVAFALSAYLWRNGSITIGTVYMIFYYTELMAKPIEKIRTQMEDLQKADASIVRIRQLLDTEPAIRDGAGTPLPAGPLPVTLDDVTFAYESGKATLDGIDFRLEPGQVLGLLGRTGSGKTTLARLMLRFYDPQSGVIRLGDVPIRDAKLYDLRRRVGMVTQSIEIFQGTVRDNLTFYDSAISDERIVRVLGELGLDSWFRSLPDGLDSKLESGGGGLSAGEAQLLAFARVFLTDPGLVILDEASSRLDPATEQRLEAAVTKLLHGRTCIIIAHRLATVQRADCILILDNGRIAEFGNRETLAADPESRFSRMLEVGMEEVLA
ncbi:ABC transporter ATP-binding protein [Paenibacillus hemerocallicola]|uniref:ABC transporter ATP-binding protein n=1 Tax=Paenibacillus hemerocallicola TaxID=1172614 RepID=A0A5C4TEB5_9BACL|nr:ABC transporter ATP-binding protein [Paenibacillus hemerocallicola]TNJ66830.1 ABC transporter ATP-binding protein [Paenibacillus hemerocallicola]